MQNLHDRSRTRRSQAVALAAALVMAGVATPPAEAQQGPGVRGGISIDPDQAYVGGHYVTAPLVDQLRFQPNVEAGFGDHRTVVALNFEFAYYMPAGKEWQLYVGGGPAINFIDFDHRDRSETEGGVNMLLGVHHRRGLFFELKVGVADSPDLKFGVGYTFR